MCMLVGLFLGSLAILSSNLVHFQPGNLILLKPLEKSSVLSLGPLKKSLRVVVENLPRCILTIVGGWQGNRVACKTSKQA